MTASKERIKVDVEDFGAACYEAGFAAGSKANRGETPKPVDTGAIHLLVDKLQLFRQSFNVNDSRYLRLGEILGEFAAVLDGKPSAKPYWIAAVKATRIKIGDEIEFAITKQRSTNIVERVPVWEAVTEIEPNKDGTRFEFSSTRFRRMVSRDDVIEVRLPEPPR